MPFRGPKTPGFNALVTDSHTCPSLFKEWPPYNLYNNLKWLPIHTFDPAILWELSNYCQCTGKWKEFPYIQAFCYINSKPKPSVLVSCLLAHMFLAMPSELEEPSISTLDPANKHLPFSNSAGIYPISLAPTPFFNSYSHSNGVPPAPLFLRLSLPPLLLPTRLVRSTRHLFSILAYCAPLQLVVQQVSNRADHASKSFLLLNLRSLQLKNHGFFIQRVTVAILTEVRRLYHHLNWSGDFAAILTKSQVR